MAIAAWNELPRFHGVPQAPGEFWKETLFPLRHIDDIAKTQEIHVRLNVLEAQVAALFRLTGMFAQYMKADAEYTAGVRDALKDFEKSLKTIGKR